MAEAELKTVVHRLAEAYRQAGGQALVVGGSVRDELLGHPTLDYDLEVYGLPADKVEKIAQQFGPTKDVGHHFGVLDLYVDDHDIDISLPRRDSKTGPGHRGFAVNTDPFLSFEDAFVRRDFTINAIGQDPLTKEYIDPFNGRMDIKNRTLRVVDPKTFAEDPLRVVRALQMVARFELEVDSATEEILRLLIPATQELPRERFRPEWEKLFLKSSRPSIGLALAQKIGYFDRWLPLASKMALTPQDPTFHPEGNVWTHTLLVVNHAKKIAPDNLPVLLAAFFHDLGKVSTTEVDGDRVRSYGHAKAAINEIKTFLSSHGFPDAVIDHVLPLVQEHMNPLQLYEMRDQINIGTIRRLARRLAPATIADVVALVEADWHGHGTQQAAERHPGLDWLLEHAKNMTIVDRPPAPVLQGRELIAIGWAPGPIFGRILRLVENLFESGMTADEIRRCLSGFSSPEQAEPALKQKLQELEARVSSKK